jgi:branched-chain amino acid transport system substrate-binding protein
MQKMRMELGKSAIILIILGAIVFACGCTGTANPSVTEGGMQENVVGVLLPLTGDSAQGGEACRVALEVAAEDINAYFLSIGSDHRVRLVVEDTATDPAVALEKVKALDKQGIRIVIGPGSSAELEAIRTYADEHGILIASTMSTAPSLAIAGDNVFRFVPPDTCQADAMARCLKEDGIAAIVPVWRGDIWGDELRNLTATAFETHNGTVLDGVRYTPGSKDYAGVTAALDREVGEAIATHGAEKVGVYAVTLEEVSAIMAAAAETKNLTQVTWYGCDGNTLLETLTVPGDAARFAAQTNFTAPTFWTTRASASWTDTLQTIQGRLGRQPDGSGLASYDTLWIVALTETQTDSKDPSELKTALTGITSMFSGKLCSMVDLDEAGDRSAAHYGFWSVKADGDAYGWVQVARYDIWSAAASSRFARVDA